MHGPALIMIGMALLIDVRLAGGVAIGIGLYRVMTWFPFQR